MKKRSFISILLSAAILLSTNSIYATEMLSYERDIFAYPTEAPLADTDTESKTLSIKDTTKYINPEKTSNRLINDRADTAISDESLFGDESYDYYYSQYSQIVTGVKTAIDNLNSYYSVNISEENETIYEILGKYFEEEDIKQIESTHMYTEDTAMYKLYACFMESDYPTEEEKMAVSGMMIDGYTILESMNALTHYKFKNKENEDGIQENIQLDLETEVSKNRLAYTANIADTVDTINNLPMKASSIEDLKQDAYNMSLSAQKFYTPQSENIQIDTKSGNLTYTRRDVEIPLESGGYMTLDLFYSAEEAQGAKYYYEEWE